MTSPSDPRRRLLALAKHRAKAKGLAFGLTVDDIVVPRYCPVLGLLLRPGRGGPSPNSPTLDRIRPAKGYVVGNVVVISHKANRIKSDASLRELLRLTAFYQQIGLK